MNKISQIVNGVTDSVKATFKERRINKALEAAILNAQEELETAKAKLEEYPMTATDKSSETIVSDLVALIQEKENAEYTLEALDKVKKYLNEE